MSIHEYEMWKNYCEGRINDESIEFHPTSPEIKQIHDDILFDRAMEEYKEARTKKEKTMRLQIKIPRESSI